MDSMKIWLIIVEYYFCSFDGFDILTQNWIISGCDAFGKIIRCEVGIV